MLCLSGVWSYQRGAEAPLGHVKEVEMVLLAARKSFLEPYAYGGQDSASILKDADSMLGKDL